MREELHAAWLAWLGAIPSSSRAALADKLVANCESPQNSSKIA